MEATITIKVIGFGAPTSAAALSVGTYFTGFGPQWRGLCLAVETQSEPLCLVLDYEGDMGDQAPTPRMLNIAQIGSGFATIPADQLVIRPRVNDGARPFLAKSASSVSHGALVVLPTGEPVIVHRTGGQGIWSLTTGKQVPHIGGGIIHPEWEIAHSEEAASYSTLARFPEEDG